MAGLRPEAAVELITLREAAVDPKRKLIPILDALLSDGLVRVRRSNFYL